MYTTRGMAAQALASGQRVIALTAHGPPPAPPVTAQTIFNMNVIGHFAEAMAWFDSLVDLSSPSDVLLWTSAAEYLAEALYAAGVGLAAKAWPRRCWPPIPSR